MSGTRIPEKSPEKPGVGKPEISPRQQTESQSDKKPGVEGQRPQKPTGGDFTASGISAKPAPGLILPQKTVFHSQVNPPSTPNIPLSNTFPQNRLSGQAVDISGEQYIPAREFFVRTAANLGLPKDALSVALLVFARFFSFSLKPALIGQLRREILVSGKASSPMNAKEKAALESEALAAVIAADKGVALSPEALERYTGFHVPPVWTPSAFTDEEKTPNDREKVPKPEELQAIAEEEEQKDGLLDFLNYLPGKNGQYWMVFPVIIRVRSIELKVYIRIYKEEQLIVDISGPKRQWRCFLKKNYGKFRADIRVYPECSPRSLSFLQKEAERFLGNENFEEILVRNGAEAPSWVEDLSALCLPSISEDV